MRPRVPPGADRDFTASAFVVDGGELLLVEHEGLDAWLQPGGHVEPRETPDETARREVHEETGIEVRLRSDATPRRYPGGSEDLPEPFRINLHEIRTGHWHVDFGYLATVAARGTPDETLARRWVAVRDLEAGRPDVPESTRRAGIDAIRAVE